MHFVIIGNGVAGMSAAEAIRRRDQQSPITILAAEPYHYYSRIRLIDYLAGSVDDDGLLLKRPEWYSAMGIEVRLGERALRFDAERHELHCRSGAIVTYDRLLIAAGANSFLPPVPGIDREGVFSLRNLSDAKRIRQAATAKDGSQVVMLGGGILSLEAASALQKSGCRITVVEFFDRLLPRQMDPQGSAVLQGLFERRGMHFVLGARTEAVVGERAANGLRLADGTVVNGDLILVGAGVRPATDLALASGLNADKGIEVDDRMATGVADVFAAGDVARHKGIVYGIWPAAMQQGTVAGNNMAGADQTFTGMLMSNTLKVAGVDLFSLGNIDSEARFEAVVVSAPEAGIYKKLVLDNGKPVGAILLGDLTSRAAIQKAVADGRALSTAEGRALLGT